MPKRVLPTLDFDSSGSAEIHFVGPIAAVGIHYANASIDMVRMVCPKSISTANHCGVCDAGTAPNPRNLAIGWDRRRKRWCFYLAPSDTFKEIFKQCSEAGVSARMMADGEGPDVLLQRIAAHTEVVIIPRTIGNRPDPMDFEAIDALNTVASESVYRKYDSVAEVEAVPAYTKANADGVGFSNYTGMSMFSGSGNGSFSGVWGVSAWRPLVSGISGVVGISGVTGHSGTDPNWKPSGLPGEAPAEPPPIRARPKAVPVKKDEVPSDRWDLMG